MFLIFRDMQVFKKFVDKFTASAAFFPQDQGR